MARGVAFIVGSATERAGGTVHDGFIGSSMKTYIRTEVRYLKPVECVVMFRDVDESAWVIGRVGPKRPLATPTVLDAEWDAARPDMPWDQSADGFWGRCSPDVRAMMYGESWRILAGVRSGQVSAGPPRQSIAGRTNIGGVCGSSPIRRPRGNVRMATSRELRIAWRCSRFFR